MAKLRRYLHNRDGWWYARVAVPVDLRHAYNSTSVKVALNTDSQTIADQRLDAAVAHIKREFDRLRSGGGEQDQLADFIQSTQSHTFPALPGAGFKVGNIHSTAPISQIPEDDLRAKLKAALQYVELYPEKGLSLIDVLKVSIAGELTEIGTIQATQAIKEELIPPAVKPYIADFDTSPQLTVHDAINAFFRDPKRENKSDESTRHYRNVFIFLEDVLGKDTPIKSIKRDPDIRTLQNVIIYQPVRGKIRWPNLTAQEISQRAIAARNAGDEINFISSSTRNLYLKLVATFFKWCYTEGLIPFTPADDLTVKLKDDREEEDRVLFSDEDLKKLFPPNYDLTGNNWLPLVLLYSSMRAGEAAQLDITDIVCVENIWCFDVDDATKGAENGKKYTDKNLKTSTSKRIIPIHQRLIDLGFMEYFFARRDAGHNKVFEVFKDGTYYPSIQPMLKTWLKSAGITGKKSAHSLRHNWRTGMYNCRADDRLTLIMGGWTLGGGIDTSVYLDTNQIPMSRRKAELDKLTFDVL